MGQHRVGVSHQTPAGATHGDAVAQSIQLAMEYDPAPPFIGGHPDQAPAAITDGLKSRVYTAAAQRMKTALQSATE